MRRAERADFWGSLERRIHAEWLLVTASMLLFTACLSLLGGPAGLTRVDHTFYDRILAATASSAPQPDIVIIAIDDGSIAELGYWPWRRAVHARLLGQLGQARVVGFDILLSDKNPAYPTDDATLASAIRANGRTVLPFMIAHGNQRIVPPLPRLADAAAAMGYINVYADGDGVVRSLKLRQPLGDDGEAQHFLLAMLQVAHIPARLGAARPDDSALLIPYGRQPSRYTVYPYARVLEGDVPASAFKDKLVLVGSWGSGLGDAFPTPVTSAHGGMAGVEIMANGLQAAVAGSWIRTPAPWLAAALACLPVLLVCLLFRRRSPRRSFIVVLSTLLLVGMAAILLLWLARTWIPVTASLIGVVLSFPVWSWRSQEASLQHIDRELRTLRHDRAALGENASPKRAAVKDASLPARITQLHGAIEQLRLAHERREETLRFLSHDMRSPQNSILALIELQQHANTALEQTIFLHRVQSYAHRTLGLVDGFVNLARARAKQLHYQTVDLVDLMAQCMDEFWAQARQRRIALRYDAHPEQAWTWGDASLLHRSVMNLLDNAIKYSSDDTEVTCRIEAHGGMWRASVRDQGRGFSAEQAATLFEAFSRVDEQADGNPSGVGLGLAFVKTVIERHGGRIEVSGAVGEGAQFTLCLPAEPGGIPLE